METPGTTKWSSSSGQSPEAEKVKASGPAASDSVGRKDIDGLFLCCGTPSIKQMTLRATEEWVGGNDGEHWQDIKPEGMMKPQQEHPELCSRFLPCQSRNPLPTSLCLTRMLLKSQKTDQNRLGYGLSTPCAAQWFLKPSFATHAPWTPAPPYKYIPCAHGEIYGGGAVS